MVEVGSNIIHAFWESSDSGLLFLSEDWDDDINLPPLLFGPKNETFSKIERLSPEQCGRYSRYYRAEESWIFVIRSAPHPQLIDRDARVYLGGDFNGWDKAIGQSDWELNPVDQISDTLYELHVPLDRIPLGTQAAFKFVKEPSWDLGGGGFFFWFCL